MNSLTHLWRTVVSPSPTPQTVAAMREVSRVADSVRAGKPPPEDAVTRARAMLADRNPVANTLAQRPE